MNSKATVPKAFEEISWIKVDNDFLETINDCRFCSVLLGKTGLSGKNSTLHEPQKSKQICYI